MCRCPAALALCLALLGCQPAEEPPTTLVDGADVTPTIVYAATQASGGQLPEPRDWVPVDLSVSPSGELWAVQRLPRHPDFTDETECVAASRTGAPHDCGGLIGSTVAITGPMLAEPATQENGRAWLVVDFNSWHFMRRPSAIAFGAPETWLDPDDPGAFNPDTGRSLFDEPELYIDTFATCSEHFTGNFTDQGPFNGPTLWTADPEHYNGQNGPWSWSNGSHLDMVHATEYCMGIAWDNDNKYWVHNGELGTIDHYDFGAPHAVGHYYHMDAVLTRYQLGDAAPRRAVDVPSNLTTLGADLFIADSGNGRVVRMNTGDPGADDGSFFSAEGIEGDLRANVEAGEVLSAATLRQEWGGEPVPAGLAVLEPPTLVVGDSASGHLTLFTPGGDVLRTLDTGLGPGMGGIAVIDGTIFVAHMVDRRIYRLDMITE